VENPALWCRASLTRESGREGSEAQKQRQEREYDYGGAEVVKGLSAFRFLPSGSLELSCGIKHRM